MQTLTKTIKEKRTVFNEKTLVEKVLNGKKPKEEVVSGK